MNNSLKLMNKFQDCYLLILLDMKYTNVRSRGGSAADIAIVVADVNKGFEPQTIESIEIKKRKVPFVVALNKVDMVSGWKGKEKGRCICEAEREIQLI